LSCHADSQFVEARKKLSRKPLPPTPVIINANTQVCCNLRARQSILRDVP
jgi:hypothetical protein